MEDKLLQKSLGYQAIKLKPISIREKKKRLFYLKEPVDRIIQRLKERIDYLSCENTRKNKQMASFKIYKKIMLENKIFSPYELEKYFEGKNDNRYPRKVR